MQKLAAKVMGASWNAWHMFDWIRNGCYVIAIYCAFYAPYHNPIGVGGCMCVSIILFPCIF